MSFRPKFLCNDCGFNRDLTGTSEPIMARMPQPVHCTAQKKDFSAPPSHCLYYTGKKSPIDAVIITATEVEYQAVINELHPDGQALWSETTTESGTSWSVCSFPSPIDNRASLRIALAMTPNMGLTATSTLAAQAIQLFRPSYLIMLGITAGRNGKTEFGDLIVPERIWDYNAGKWEETEKWHIFGTRRRLNFLSRRLDHPIDPKVRNRFKKLERDQKLASSIHDQWRAKYPARKPFKCPKIRVAPMVSGAAVVDSAKIWQMVSKQADTVIGLDMEAYAIYHAARELQNPPFYCIEYIVAKSVCDFGMNKSDDAQEFAAFTSVRFFKEYILLYALGVDLERRATRLNMPLNE